MSNTLQLFWVLGFPIGCVLATGSALATHPDLSAHIEQIPVPAERAMIVHSLCSFLCLCVLQSVPNV